MNFTFKTILQTDQSASCQVVQSWLVFETTDLKLVRWQIVQQASKMSKNTKAKKISATKLKNTQSLKAL